MTPEERFLELKDQSDNLKQRNMFRFHFLRNIREVVNEALEDCAKDLEALFPGHPLIQKWRERKQAIGQGYVRKKKVEDPT